MPDPFPEVFNVTLVNSVQNSTHPGRGNLTSEITILVIYTALDSVNVLMSETHSQIS